VYWKRGRPRSPDPTAFTGKGGKEAKGGRESHWGKAPKRKGGVQMPLLKKDFASEKTNSGQGENLKKERSQHAI